jgi:hypothetical protein
LFQWVFPFSKAARIAEDAFCVRAIPCSAVAQQRHKIIPEHAAEAQIGDSLRDVDLAEQLARWVISGT